MTSQTSQEFESYVPVYDAIPEKWEDAQPFLVETLKKISNAVNTREIGWLLDEELLSGKAFIPVAIPAGDASPQQFRSVLRKVIDCSPLVAGLNAGVAHNITVDNRFTLIDMWVAGTNSGTLTALVINGNDVVLSATNITITSPQAFDRAFAIVEYIQEI
jgi:hypothetical protein